MHFKWIQGVIMTISFKTIRLAVTALFISIVLQSTIEAYPYAYRRLVLKQNGKITKVIDFISDVHLPEKEFDVEQIAAMSENQDIALMPTQLSTSCNLGKTEESLLEIFEKIGNEKKGEKITMIGESSYITRAPEGCKRSGFILGVIGETFYNRFNIEKNKGLIYQDGDCYRNFLMENTESKSEIELLATTISPKAIKKLCQTITTDLTTARRTIDQKTYSKIEKIWSEFKLCPSKDIVVGDNAFLRIADFELLLKILKSNTTHVIVYAGGNHCKIVSEMLVKEFNFVATRSIGINVDTFQESWSFLWVATKTLIKTLWYSNFFSANKKKSLKPILALALMQEVRKASPPIRVDEYIQDSATN